MYNKIKLSLLFLLAAFCASSCHTADANKTANSIKKEECRLLVLAPHTISSQVKLPGVLQPFEFVQIFPKLNGFVKDVFVDRGSVVKKGALLIRMEAPELEQKVSASKLKYAQAHAM